MTSILVAALAASAAAAPAPKKAQRPALIVTREDVPKGTLMRWRNGEREIASAEIVEAEGKPAFLFEKGTIPSEPAVELDAKGRPETEWAVCRAKEGKRLGKLRGFLPDGTKTFEFPPFDARCERNGVAFTFHPDGKLRSAVPWTHGLMEGVGRAYRRDGTIESEITHLAGEPHGKALIFAADGKTWTEKGVYVHGLKEGPWVLYEKDGKTIAEIRSYRAGELQRAEKRQ